MNNFDLVGEMSLEQLEHNIEKLHGKEKAIELVDILRHTNIKSSMQNKFYASIFNKIQAQNSLDTIIKNPSQIIASVKKDLITFEKIQQENLNIKNLQLNNQTVNSTQNLLENPIFTKSPIEYIANLSEEEQNEFFSDTFDLMFSEDQLKNFIPVIKKLVNNPNAKFSNEEQNKLKDSMNFDLSDPIFSSPKNRSSYLDLYLHASVAYKQLNINPLDLDNNQIIELLQQHSQNIEFEKKQDADILISRAIKAIQKNYSKNKNIDEIISDTLEYSNDLDNYDLLETKPNDTNELFTNLYTTESTLQTELVNQANYQDIETFCYEAMQQAYDPYSIEQEHELKNDENFDINTIGTFDEQTELLQQILDSNAEPQQDIPQQSVPIGTVEYIQQQMQEQKALEELEQSEKASNTPEKPDFTESSETNDNSYLVEVNEKKSFFQTIKSGVSNFFKRINQKSLPNPNESKAKHTNMSLDDYDRKARFMSAIRSFGDKITNATKAITNLSKANKQPLNTPASMDYQNNSEQNLDISGNPSSTNTKKDFIKPKAVETVAKSQPRESHTNFDKFIKVNNAGNKIEQAAMSTKKTPNTADISQTKSNGQSHDDNDEQQFVE